jgi:xanthine dehydrogenase accessory factor
MRQRLRSGGESAAFAGGALAGGCLSSGVWLSPLTGPWIDAARAHLTRHAALVRVTVVALRGSAPREPGASMLVDDKSSVGTIGGGRLEWHAVRAAHELLRAIDSPPVQACDLILGPELGQCCGGRVELWLERLTRHDLPWLHEASLRMRHRSVGIETRFANGTVTRELVPSFQGTAGIALRRDPDQRLTLYETYGPRRPPLWIFGAGHVGQALVRLLSELAVFDILWIDPRPELLPAGLPECVATQVCASPAGLLGAARADTRYVVLTHDHALDYELCRSILGRGDFAFLGLIGSASKSARFRSRLLRDGIEPGRVSRLTCPIGVQGIPSKLPAAIAIAIAAQLLQLGADVARARAGDSDSHACDGACGTCGAQRRTEI